METLDVAITGTRNILELSKASDARFIIFFPLVKYMTIQKQRMCQPQKFIVEMFPAKGRESATMRANGWVKQLLVFFIIRPE